MCACACMWCGVVWCVVCVCVCVCVRARARVKNHFYLLNLGGLLNRGINSALTVLA